MGYPYPEIKKMCGCVCVCCRFSCVSLFATRWTVACQVPLSMGFPRQEYWSGLPCPSPRDLREPGMEPTSPALQADSLSTESPGKPPKMYTEYLTLGQVLFRVLRW